MTTSPGPGENRERVTLSVAGRDLEVVAMTGEEALSRPFRFDLVCRAARGAWLPDALLAEDAAITLFDPIGARRTVRGIVTCADVRVSDDGTTAIALSVGPRACLLALGRSSRVFHDRTALDMAEELLAGAGQPARREVTYPLEARPYRVQRAEDDLSFVTRLLGEEGIFYRFDDAAGGPATLVLCDESATAPGLEGGEDIMYSVRTDLSADRERVEELGLVVAATPTRFTRASFDPARPDLHVIGGAGEGRFEVYDAPGGGPTTPDACERQARLALEAARARSLRAIGQASCVRIAPGRVMRVVDHPLPLDGDRFFVTRVEHHLRQRGSAAGDAAPYTCRFEAIPVATRYRPPAETAARPQPGLEHGVVVGPAGAEIHPDAAGRVRVKWRWDRDPAQGDRAGGWMRVAQRATEASMLLPRVGFSVLGWHEEGDVDAPSVLSRIHDAEHPPLYALPAHATRVVWSTATTPGGGSFNEIHFEDRRGGEELVMLASRDMVLLTQHVKNDAVGRDAHREIGHDHHLSVGATSAETVTGDQTVAIGGGESVTVGQGRSKEVTGHESMTIAGTRTLTAGDRISLGVDAGRRLSTGGALVEAAPGPVVTVAGRDMATLTGGAEVRVAGGAVSSDVGAARTRTVGGPRVEIAARDLPQSTGVSLVETAGGSMFLRSGGAFVDGATRTSTWTAAGSIESAAPDIAVEATDSIELRCGASAIVVTRGGIEIRSPSLDLSGATLEVKTLVVEHN